jgi:hypothetical protein
MWYDEFIGDIKAVSSTELISRKIGRGEALHVQRAGSNPDGARRDDVKKPRMMTGQYVPDEEHAQICLNCTKKKCKGSCSLMSRTTTGKKRQKKEAVL